LFGWFIQGLDEFVLQGLDGFFKDWFGLFKDWMDPSRTGWIDSSGLDLFSGVRSVLHDWIGFSRVGIFFHRLDKNGFSKFFRISNFLLFRLFKELLTYISTCKGCGYNRLGVFYFKKYLII
jgi:hypothetical protein